MSAEQNNEAPPKETEGTEDQGSKAATKLLWIPKKDYIKFTYIALMAASVLGLLAAFVGAVSGLASLTGLTCILLAILGFTIYKREFTDAQLSHFKFVGVIFIISFVLGILLSVVFGGNATLLLVVTPLVNLAALALMFTGYRLNESRTPASKESVINELKSLKP